MPAWQAILLFLSKGTIMSIVKVIEVIASSDKSWEDAAQQGVKGAAKTVKNIKHFYVENMSAVVEDDKIKEYRINGKISFVING